MSEQYDIDYGTKKILMSNGILTVLQLNREGRSYFHKGSRPHQATSIVCGWCFPEVDQASLLSVELA